MAADHNHLTTPKSPPPTQSITTFRWSTRRRTTRITISRKRKLPTIRLGQNKQRRGVSVVKILRRMKLRWMKLQYSCLLKKLKTYYRNLIRDIVEAGATLETFHHRLLMETSLAVPMGVSFSSFPAVSGSDRPFSLFM